MPEQCHPRLSFGLHMHMQAHNSPTHEHICTYIQMSEKLNKQINRWKKERNERKVIPILLNYVNQYPTLLY